MSNKKVKILPNVTKLTESVEALSESYDIYILFIDLCNSTELKQTCIDNNLPDITWIIRQKIFLERAASIITKYKGSLIKTIGDELMTTFNFNSNPIEIINCCGEIINTFGSLKSYNKGIFKIYSKIAVDYGTCYDGNIINMNVIDPIGTPVDRCARISKYANQNEIVFSSSFKETLQQRGFDFSKYTIRTKLENLRGLGEVEFHTLKL